MPLIKKEAMHIIGDLIHVSLVGLLGEWYGFMWKELRSGLLDSVSDSNDLKIIILAFCNSETL